jgi:hypothetical protein
LLVLIAAAREQKYSVSPASSGFGRHLLRVEQHPADPTARERGQRLQPPVYRFAAIRRGC